MRVDSSSVPGSITTTTPKAGAQGSAPAERFGALLRQQAAPVEAPVKAASVSPAILCAIPTPNPPRDREAYRHAKAMLAALRGLQAALLAGGESAARETLQSLTDTTIEADDPELAEAVRQIALRAAVELARPS